MIITYLGHQFFKIQHGDLTIAIDPPQKSSRFKSSKFGADIVLSSLKHEDFDGYEEMGYGDKVPFAAYGPGEYEVGGIFIKGLTGHSTYKKDKTHNERINTIYTLTVDGIRLCFLGAQDAEALPAETKEALEDIDILFVPIGGDGVLEPTQAYKLAVSLEPKLIIPTHFDPKNDETLLKTFLKEGGVKDVKDVEMPDKLTIKRKDLDGKDGDIVVLYPQLGA